MKFHVNSYHFKLLRDYERLSVFKEAIESYAEKFNGEIDSHDVNCVNNNDSCSSEDKIAFDLGCGSGVLSFFASPYMDKIIAIELNS